jgi:hypothetical protein
MDFDFVTFLEGQRFDYPGRQANREAVSPFCNLHAVLHGKIYMGQCISFRPDTAGGIRAADGKRVASAVCRSVTFCGTSGENPLAGMRALPACHQRRPSTVRVGGILSACALAAWLAPLTPFTAAAVAMISLLLGVPGFVGGLLLSALKRQRGIKDWGTLIPGHGGMLDRLDSLCLSAPVLYYLLRCGWSP